LFRELRFIGLALARDSVFAHFDDAVEEALGEMRLVQRAEQGYIAFFGQAIE
jgi:hypothetical protein